MTPAPTRQEKLRQFIDDFFDGKQKRLADEYGLSPSQVSTWLNAKSDIADYMEKIIDLSRRAQTLSAELEAMRVGRVLKMKAGYAVVHFPDAAAPGTILCRGIPDIEAANRVLAALRAAEAPHSSKES
jgi:DNA-binding transcriptional regulator YdaS (Cro superfamily)